MTFYLSTLGILTVILTQVDKKSIRDSNKISK